MTPHRSLHQHTGLIAASGIAEPDATARAHRSVAKMADPPGSQRQSRRGPCVAPAVAALGMAG